MNIQKIEVLKYWSILVLIYVISSGFVGMISGFASAFGYMLSPFLIGAVLLRRAETAKSVRNIHIFVALICAFLIWQEMSDLHKTSLTGIADGCINNNAAVDASGFSVAEEVQYCNCFASGIANDVFKRSVIALLMMQPEDEALQSIATDSALQTKISEVQVSCLSDL
jgi:hypothetical protein